MNQLESSFFKTQHGSPNGVSSSQSSVRGDYSQNGQHQVHFTVLSNGVYFDRDSARMPYLSSDDYNAWRFTQTSSRNSNRSGESFRSVVIDTHAFSRGRKPFFPKYKSPGAFNLYLPSDPISPPSPPPSPQRPRKTSPPAMVSDPETLCNFMRVCRAHPWMDFAPVRPFNDVSVPIEDGNPHIKITGYDQATKIGDTDAGPCHICAGIASGLGHNPNMSLVFKVAHGVAPLKLKKCIRTALFQNLRLDPHQLKVWLFHPECYTPQMFWRDCVMTGRDTESHLNSYSLIYSTSTHSETLRSLLISDDVEDIVHLPITGYDQATKVGDTDPGPKPGKAPAPGVKREIKKDVKKEVRKEVKRDMKVKNKGKGKAHPKKAKASKPIHAGEYRSTKEDTIYSESIEGQDVIQAFASGKLADISFDQASNQIIYDGVISLQELAALQDRDATVGSTLSEYMSMYTQYRLKSLNLDLHMKDMSNYDFEIGACVLDAMTPVDLSNLSSLYELRVSEPNTARLNRNSVRPYNRKDKKFTHTVRVPVNLVKSTRYCRPGLNSMNRGLVRLIIFVYQQPTFVPVASTSEYASFNPINGKAGICMFNSTWRFMQKIPPGSRGTGYFVNHQVAQTDRTLEAEVTDANTGTSREVTQAQFVAPPEVALSADEQAGDGVEIQVAHDGASDTIKAFQTFASGLSTVIGFIFPEAAPVLMGIELVLAVASEIISTFDKQKKKDSELSEANGLSLDGGTFTGRSTGPVPACSPSLSTKGNMVMGSLPQSYYDQLPPSSPVTLFAQATAGMGGFKPADPSSPILVLNPDPVSSQFEYDLYLSDSSTGPRLLGITDDAVAGGQIAGPESSVGGRPLFIDGAAPRPYVPVVASSTGFYPAIKCVLQRYFCVIYDTADPNALNVVPLIHHSKSGTVHTFHHILYPQGTYIGDNLKMAVLCGFFGGSQSAGVAGDFIHSVVSYAYRGRTSTTDNANKIASSSAVLTMDTSTDFSASTPLSYCGVIDTVVEIGTTTTLAGIRTPRWWFTELLTRDPSTHKLRVPILSNADTGVGTRHSPIYAMNADF